MGVSATQPRPEPQATPGQSTAILPLSLNAVSYEAGGQHLINGITFTLNAGPRTVVMGPNGAGKSLLLRLCHGLIVPTAGSVQWQGRAVHSARHQAMVFQRPVLMRRTVAANVAYALKLRSVARTERAPIIENVLSRTGLARFADRPARLLSGGEQQKLALARAWATRPEVLFLDEPTASLDPAATHAVESIIQTMHDEGTRIIMVTHDIGQARRLADEVLFLHKGQLMEHTAADTFFNAPESGEAAAFLKGELRW